jgi:hypothetical protein
MEDGIGPQIHRARGSASGDGAGRPSIQKQLGRLRPAAQVYDDREETDQESDGIGQDVQDLLQPNRIDRSNRVSPALQIVYRHGATAATLS